MAGKTPRTPSTRPRPTARDVAEQADRILADALKRERDYKRKGMSSVTLPRDELIRKLTGRTAHSPFLTQIGWGNPVRGSTFVLNFGLMNPDPWPYDNGNLGLCFCYSDAGAVTEPGLTLLRAEPSIGVRQVDARNAEHGTDAVPACPPTTRSRRAFVSVRPTSTTSSTPRTPGPPGHCSCAERSGSTWPDHESPEP